MTPEEFDDLFDTFASTAFHLETHQTYAVDEEDESLRAFQQGLPRPERSVRTSPWLRRIAVTTASGKQWSRVHVIEHPLTEYLRYELIGYLESQAVGEEVRLADRAERAELAALGPDSWLFDHGTPQACGALLHFDTGGHLLDVERVTDPVGVRELERQYHIAWTHSATLAEYLAAHKIALNMGVGI